MRGGALPRFSANLVRIAFVLFFGYNLHLSCNSCYTDNTQTSSISSKCKRQLQYHKQQRENEIKSSQDLPCVQCIANFFASLLLDDTFMYRPLCERACVCVCVFSTNASNLVRFFFLIHSHCCRRNYFISARIVVFVITLEIAIKLIAIFFC